MSSILGPMAIALLTLFFGGLAFWAAHYFSRELRRRSGWPSVPGKILERGVGEPMGSGRSYLPRVKYSYSVAGKDYTNDQVYTIRRTGGLADQMQKLVDGLPDPVPVYYDPADPASSHLLRNSRGTFWLLIAFGAIVSLLGLLRLLAAAGTA